MAGESQNMRENSWPIPEFYFIVDLWVNSGMGEVPFQEVSGLDMKSEVIEYLAGNDNCFSTAKIPCLL